MDRGKRAELEEKRKQALQRLEEVKKSKEVHSHQVASRPLAEAGGAGSKGAPSTTAHGDGDTTSLRVAADDFGRTDTALYPPPAGIVLSPSSAAVGVSVTRAPEATVPAASSASYMDGASFASIDQLLKAPTIGRAPLVAVSDVCCFDTSAVAPSSGTGGSPTRVTYNAGVQTEVEENTPLQERGVTMPAPASQRVAASATLEPVEAMCSETKPAVALPPAELQQVLASKQFTQFVQSAASMVEREFSDTLYPVPQSKHTASANDLLQVQCTIGEPFGTRRAVTDVDWAPHATEIVCASYSGEGASVSGTGASATAAVAVWNILHPSKPVTLLSTPESVLSVRFSPFDPYLIAGGCASGVVLYWDVRSGRDPIASTAFTSNSHIYPISSLLFPPNSSASTLFSFSTDGRVSQFGGTDLGDPIMTSRVKQRKGDTTTDVLPAAAQFSPVTPSRLYIGGEEGSLYTCDLTAKAVHVVERVSAHAAFITSVDPHPSPDANLLLTASFDHTVKLWSLEDKVPREVEVFEASLSYVTCALWSPTNDSLFASADSDGLVYLYALDKDPIDPMFVVENGGGAAVNRLKWSPDGRHLCAGDVSGSLSILELQADFVRTSTHGDAATLNKAFSSRAA